MRWGVNEEKFELVVEAYVAVRITRAPARRNARWAEMITSGSSLMGFADQSESQTSTLKTS